MAHTNTTARPGQALVEFVIMMPFVVVLLLASTYIGFGLLQYHVTASHLRGVHKNMERYASLIDPLYQIQQDVGNGYTVTEEGGNKFRGRVIKATKTYSIPNLPFIPAITLISSTTVPGALMEGLNGPFLPALSNLGNGPGTYPDIPGSGGGNAIGSAAIQLAESNLFRDMMFCADMTYCYGRDLAGAATSYASSDLSSHYTGSVFSHVTDNLDLALPGGVYMDASCTVTDENLGHTTTLSRDSNGDGTDDLDFSGPQVVDFLADNTTVALHPQCLAGCNTLHAGGTQADFDSCVNPCLTGKLANARAYVNTHIQLATAAGGCGTETIVTPINPVVN